MSISTVLNDISSVLQVAATPSIALLGAGIAWQQAETAKQQAKIARDQAKVARDKFEHDIFEKLYDRRVVVFEATRDIFARIYDPDKKEITAAEVEAYGFKTLDAKFLFDEKLYRYLRDVHFHIGAYSYQMYCENIECSEEEREDHRRIAHNHLEWIHNQGNEYTGFATKFEKYLIYKPPA